MFRILVIEDDATLRESIAEALTLSGYHVRMAENGKVALGILRQYKPHIIISDVKMPELDGLALLKILQTSMPVPFIFISAKAEREDIRLGMDSGADDYLTKPFRIDELLNSIKARLNKITAQQYSYESMEDLEMLETNLTDKEKEILKGIAQGYSTQQIADEHFISPKTVENHRYNIMTKLGLKGKNELMKYAIQRKIMINLL